MKEAENTSKKVIKAIDSTPIIVEYVTTTDEPTLERHLKYEDLMKIASQAKKDALLLDSPIIMQTKDSSTTAKVTPTLALQHQFGICLYFPQSM